MLTRSMAARTMQSERQRPPSKRRAGETRPKRVAVEAEAVAEAEEKKPQEFEIGKVVDLKTMLSSPRRKHLVSTKRGLLVPISSLHGKYVLICSFTMPFNASICQSLEALYSEMSLQWAAVLVEFVILLDYDYPSDFNASHHFFESLSFSCLTIPLNDYTSSLSICKSLPPHDLGGVSCLAIHHTGRVLQNTPYFLYTYGAASFPFSKDHFDMIRQRDHYIKFRFSTTTTFDLFTLEQLLHCDSLPLLADPNNFIDTYSLRDIPVGLYLYCTGQHLDQFLDIHQQCLNKGLDFKIILVPLPFANGTRHPDSFFKHMKESVLASCPTSSWLTFPFNDQICRTLWRLHSRAPFDQLIIMPLTGFVGDLEGRSIIRRYGIESYPFTRDFVLEMKVAHLRSRTLESLLGDDHGLDIRKKNVILYIVDPYAADGCNYSHNIVLREYANIKKLYPDTQLYTVPLVPVSCHLLEKLGFGVLPEEKWESVIDHVFMSNDPLCNETAQETIVAFGKDGKVLSRFAYDHMDFLTAASIFDDVLRSQIWAEIQREIDTA